MKEIKKRIQHSFKRTCFIALLCSFFLILTTVGYGQENADLGVFDNEPIPEENDVNKDVDAENPEVNTDIQDTSEVKDNEKQENNNEQNSVVNTESLNENIDKTEEVPPKPITLEEKSVIRSIKISTDRDIILWLSNLGLDISGARNQHEERLLNYYNLPSNALDDDFLNPPKKSAEVSDKDEATNEAKETEEDKKDKLIQDEVFEETLAEGETSEIVIENAQSAQYFTYEEINEDVFTLKGNIKISVNQKSNGKLHVITADKLVYNETLRVGSAIGNVYYRVYEYSGDKPPSSLPSESTEEFTGQVISFNIDDFNSDMIRGSAFTEKEVKYGKENELSETLSFRIYSPHISKSKENVIVLSNASFTSGSASPPIYRIRLKRIWILAPEEWAISRATIFLGDIPVIWFPFFVNPGDKFFFHPGIGYKTRGGGYFNTTTYLIGDSTNDEQEAFLDIFNFSKQSAKKKVIKGLYLKEAEEGDVIKKYPTSWNLKYILDYYTTVGGYTSLVGNFPVWKFTKLSFTGGIAFSHTVFNIEETYFNNYVDEEGNIVKHFDEGVIYNTKVPFRYEFKFNTSLGFGSVYTTSLNFEQYSDSYFKRDFYQRVYDFDWQQILDPNKGTTDLNNRPSEIGSYIWEWTNNVSIPTSKILGKYLNDITISNFRLKMDWSRKNVDTEFKPEAYNLRPAGSSLEQEIEGKFFYPSKAEVPSYQLRASGTLLSIDSTNLDFSNGMKNTVFFEERNDTSTNLNESDNNTEVPGIDASNANEASEPGALVDEKELIEEEKELTEEEKLAQAKAEEKRIAQEAKLAEEKRIEELLKLPIQTPFSSGFSQDNFEDANESTPLRATGDILQPSEELKEPSVYDFNWKKIIFGITYNVSHTLSEILYFEDDNWKQAPDIDFFTDKLVEYGEATTNNTFGLQGNLSFFDSILSYNYGLTFALRRRVLTHADNLEDNDKENKEKSALNYTQEKLSNTHSLSLLPLKMFPIFSGTKINYTANFDLGENVFSTKEEVTWFDPEDKEWWNSHSLTQSYSAKYAGISNTLALTTELPPRLISYTPSYSLGIASYLTFSLSTKIYKEDNDLEEYEYNPLSISIGSSWFSGKLSVNQQISHNYEENFVESTSTSFKAWWFSLNFTSKRAKESEFSASTFSFTETGEEILRPSALTAKIDYSTPDAYFWKDRISLVFDINTTYTHNFLRFTGTKWNMSYGLSFKVYKFLTLSFKSGISNNLMFLYYQDFADQAGVQKRDFWKDLGDSLSIGDEKKLKETPFKLDNLSLSFTQDFGGWVLNFSYFGSPKREFVNNKASFEWKNTLEISVFWKPIASLKTSVYYRDEQLSLDEEVE